MRPLPLLAAALSATFLAACAGDGAPAMASGGAATAPARQCFFANAVTSFKAVGDRAVNVRVSVDDVYRLELLAPCPDIDWANEIALQAHAGDSICTGLDATIVSPSSAGLRRCEVRSVRRLTPDEVAALPGDQRP